MAVSFQKIGGIEMSTEAWISFVKEVTNDIDVDLLQKFSHGISRDMKRYIRKKYPTAVFKVNKRFHIKEEALKDIDIRTFRKEYFKKIEADYSAKDIVEISYRRMGIPPVEAMSPDSLEKSISELLNSPEYKRNVYIRHGKGGKNLRCVDPGTARKIAAEPDVQDLISKQTRKAEKAGGDSEDWKRYELEKRHIESMNALIEMGELQQPYLSRDEEMFLMVKALYSLFFTDFDIDTYEKDITDLEALESAQDYGKDYQELDRVLKAPNFDWKYYQVKESSLLDVLADKIAEKILERLTDKKEES